MRVNEVEQELADAAPDHGVTSLSGYPAPPGRFDRPVHAYPHTVQQSDVGETEVKMESQADVAAMAEPAAEDRKPDRRSVPERLSSSTSVEIGGLALPATPGSLSAARRQDVKLYSSPENVTHSF